MNRVKKELAKRLNTSPRIVSILVGTTDRVEQLLEWGDETQIDEIANDYYKRANRAGIWKASGKRLTEQLLREVKG